MTAHNDEHESEVIAMSNLVRQTNRVVPWSVFGDFDDFFDGFVRARKAPEVTPGQAIRPDVDIRETDNEYQVQVDLPGIKKENLDIVIQDGVLTINAETREENQEVESGRLIRQERRYGKYIRSLRLGADVNEDSVRAEYRDGILSLSIPKAEEVKPKRVQVEIN